MGACAECERALRRERQREGMTLATQRGRKKARAPDQVPALRACAEAGAKKVPFARACVISRETLSESLRT